MLMPADKTNGCSGNVSDIDCKALTLSVVTDGVTSLCPSVRLDPVLVFV